MDKIKMFFSLLKFEVIKLFRNKLLFIFLIIFPVAMIVTLNAIDLNYKDRPSSGSSGGSSGGTGGTEQTEIDENAEKYIALYANGEVGQDEKINEVISNYYASKNILVVDTFEEGKNLLKTNEVYFLIFINTQTEPTSAVFYYDSASSAGSMLVSELRKEQLKYTYESLKAFLDHYHISINENYFNFVSFEPIQDTIIDYKQRTMPITAGFVAIVIMFGLAYSMARDNETNVIKQICYTPISVNKYLLSKTMPFLILGMIQACALMLLGSFAYGVVYQTNGFLIYLMYILFILASLGLGLIFSSLKNQTTATFATMIAIMLPLLLSFFGFIKSFPIIVKIFAYFFPLTPFLQLYTQMSFNGVISVYNFIILIVQTIAYYVIAYFLARKKAGALN